LSLHNWILNFEKITELPLPPSPTFLLPALGLRQCRTPEPAPPPGRPHIAPPTKPPARPRVEPKPLRPGFSSRHAPRRRPCVTRRQRRRRSPSPASVALPGRIDLPQAPPLRLPAGPPPPRAYRRRHFPCTRGQDAPAIFPNSGELGSPWSYHLEPPLTEQAPRPPPSLLCGANQLAVGPLPHRNRPGSTAGLPLVPPPKLHRGAPTSTPPWSK